MPFYIFYVLILLILAYLIGCIIGWLLKRWLSAETADSQTEVTPQVVTSAPAPIAEPEPIAAVADVPTPTEADKPATLQAPIDGKADDLKRIKGIGKVNEDRLHKLGIFHFSQIAAWQQKEVDWVNGYLSFSGRIEREDWIAQAKLLAAGAETEFSKRVDKGEVESSK